MRKCPYHAPASALHSLFCRFCNVVKIEGEVFPVPATTDALRGVLVATGIPTKYPVESITWIATSRGGAN